MNREPNSEKNPLDDLFARRLGKLERPPSPDSFTRLQQRMQGGQEQPRLVFWRNPTMQMAAAACVAAVLLFGWLYTADQSAGPLSGTGSSVAVRDGKQRAPIGPVDRQPANRLPQTEAPTQQFANNESTPARKTSDRQPASQTSYMRKQPSNGEPTHVASLAGTKPAGVPTKPQTVAAGSMNTSKIAPEQIASVPTAPATQKPATERVLVVTIDEPEALVAARQTAASVVNNMPVLAASPSKEGKATFWQQVKRLKQDDDVARQGGSTDESGLLSRAYKGIKQRLEKDKPAKQ